MREFEINSDIESVPKIIGIRSVYAFIFFGAIMFSLFIALIGFSWIKTSILIVGDGVVYLILLYMTESFQANSVSDTKLPDVISNNPNQ